MRIANEVHDDVNVSVSFGKQPELRIIRASKIQKTRLRAVREDIR
jgi:hypothetical protein